MGMTKPDLRNHRFHHIQQILFGTLADLPRRHGCRRMGYEDRAESSRHATPLDKAGQPIGQIDDFLRLPGLDSQGIHHPALQPAIMCPA